VTASKLFRSDGHSLSEFMCEDSARESRARTPTIPESVEMTIPEWAGRCPRRPRLIFNRLASAFSSGENVQGE
jgi:hypothetical protein